MPPNDLNLKSVYASLCVAREDFLDAAEDISALTIPSIEPRGEPLKDKPGRPLRPYTHMGAMAIRSLASSLFKIMLPPGVKWGKLNLSPESWQAIDLAVGPEQSMLFRDMLAERSEAIIESLEQKLSRSRGAKSIRRNLVEGNTCIVNNESGLAVFPLRSFVVERHNGHPRVLVIKEELRPDPVDRVTRTDSTTINKYTLVRFPFTNPVTGDTSEGGVWVQKGDDGTPQRIEDSPMQYFVFVPEIPEYEDYAYAYTHDFLRLIAQINHGEESLGEAMFAAAYNRPILREGSSTAARFNEFVRGKSGDPWVGNIDDLGWFSSEQKIGDWSFIVQLMIRWSQDMATAFALGIKDRPSGSPSSATEVLQIVDELNTQVQDLHTAYEQTFQRALFSSEMALFERRDPIFGDSLPEEVASLVKIEITTGTSVLSKQQALLKFATQFLPAVQAMDPMRFQVNGGPMADTFAASLPFPTDGLYSWNSQPPQASIPGGGAPTGNGEPPREETIMTAGGPQPPQPPQGPPPSPLR